MDITSMPTDADTAKSTVALAVTWLLVSQYSSILRVNQTDAMKSRESFKTSTPNRSLEMLFVSDPGPDTACFSNRKASRHSG